MKRTGPLTLLSEAKNWKTDVPSGLVVFLVAIPLCLGIALASGGSAMSGIIAGIVGGLIVTLFSNSSLGVSGPAAGLVAIVAPAIAQLGFQNFLLAVVLSGVIQFVLGIFKAGVIGYYFPTSVIKGMLAAIGLIIILKQIPHAVGYDKDYEGDLAFSQADGHNTFTEIWQAFQNPTPTALIITLVCLAILVLWEMKMKKFAFAKIVQGPLVAVLAGIALNLAFCSVDNMKLNNDQVVSLPVWNIDELPEGSIALDKAFPDGMERFQTRTIKEGPIVFKAEDGKFYREDNPESGVAKLPDDMISEKLNDPAKDGSPRFQLSVVKNGPVYFKGEDGKYHLDAPLFIFPHFDPGKVKATDIQFGHGSHGADHSTDSADVTKAETEAKLNMLDDAIKGVSDEDAAKGMRSTIQELRESLLLDSSKEPAEGGATPFRTATLILLTAVTLAIVASLESLLCAEATDKLDPQRRQTDLNQELRAQGIGNFVSGLFGGLPVTQVIVRSSTNIQSGGQSRFASFVHGLFLVTCVIAIPYVLNLIPLASLAAILFVVGYKLAHPSKFKEMYANGWTQFLPFVITIGAILATDLLIGIAIGLIVSLFFILQGTYFKSLWTKVEEKDGQKIHHLTLAEQVFFINKGKIQEAIQQVRPGSKVIIDTTNTVHMDQDVRDIFTDFQTNAEFDNIEIEWVEPFGTAVKKDPARVEGFEG